MSQGGVMKKELSLNQFRMIRFSFLTSYLFFQIIRLIFDVYIIGLLMSLSFIVAMIISFVMNRKIKKKELVLDEMAQKNENDAWFLAFSVLGFLLTCATIYTFLEQKPIVLYYFICSFTYFISDYEWCYFHK